MCVEDSFSQIRSHLLHKVGCDTISKSTILSNYVEQWRSKALHGQWPKLMEELAADSFHWLKNALLEPVTEALLVAAQDQALNTNWLSFHIHGRVSSDLCRCYRMLPETIEYIIAGCPSIAQSFFWIAIVL